jgi:aspartyl protease family protein
MGRIDFDPDAFGIVLFATIGHGDVKRRLKMVLDTGATYCMIPWHIGEELGYEPALSRKHVPINTANGQIHVPMITIESMMVLGKKIENCEILVHDLPETSRVDGLIGLNFLKHCKLILDFHKGELELK